ncbi:hypothetical protein WDW37_05245 [Bdellovibrionota bacterium FG-1]
MKNQFRRKWIALWPIVVFVAVGAVAASALAFEYQVEPYEVTETDTLSEVLEKKVNNPAIRLYGEKGLVARNQKLNPKVKNWRHLRPGTTLKLELPVIPKLESPVVIPPPEVLPTPAPLPIPTPTPTVEVSIDNTQAYFHTRFRMGAERAHLSETVADAVTETGGLWTLPSFAFEIERFNEASSWRPGGQFALARVAALDDVSFPMTWAVGAHVTYAADGVFSPYALVEVEKFVQATVSISQTVVAYQVRSTTAFWPELGGVFTTTLGGQWVETKAGISYSPLIKSSSDAVGAVPISLNGFRGTLTLNVGLTPHLFGSMTTKIIRLGGDATLSGEWFGLSLGLRL